MIRIIAMGSFIWFIGWIFWTLHKMPDPIPKKKVKKVKKKD